MKTNGGLKWTLGIIAVIGLLLTLAATVWNASQIAGAVEANCKDDAKYHLMAETNKDAIIGMNKDIESIQRDIATQTIIQQKILTSQEAMLKVIRQ